MKSKDALRVLAEVTAYQWGMVTSAQASMHGITRLDLSRLAADGQLERVAHGVYKNASAPAGPHDDLKEAWLCTDPKTTGEARIKDLANGVVVAGESAADLHDIGDFRALRHEFVSPARRQSQRSAIRYRRRTLDPGDVTLVDGLPVMTMERTIADLIEQVGDLSLVADALRDASSKRTLDLQRLRGLLAPLAAREGFKKDDGDALLNRLTESAGIDVESLTRLIARSPTYSSLAQVARLVRNVDAASGTRGEAVPGRRYDGFMAETAAPTCKTFSGPTGRRVAAHRGELLEVLRRHDVTNPEIFGSAARGDDHEGSDVDILVDFPPGTSIIDIIGIQHELEDLLGVPVDLVPRSGLKERVRSRAAKDLLPL
jgi:predicted nucleotidyltransferase/predicted transcriptional regulator of viral defense system